MNLDPGESRRIEAASRKLDLLPANAPASDVFDAIRSCVPVEAGLFGIIRPGANDALVSQPLRLPPDIFESWLHTPPDMLQVILAPVVASKPGRLWPDSIRGAQREQFEVLRKLDGAGLGEGAAYKLLERPTAWYGVEHLMLALIMGRNEHFQARSQMMLDALHERIRAAVLRSALPLVAREPIHAQIMAEQSLGYICLSPSGSVLEANRRARHLVERYGSAAGIRGLRGAVEDFAARAREQARGGQPWQIRSAGPPSSFLLQVDAHQLAKESHPLTEDTILLYMREVPEPPVASSTLPALEQLTKRQREIALLLAHTDLTMKEIADQLGIRLGTMRKHTENIYYQLGVTRRAELMLLLNK